MTKKVAVILSGCGVFDGSEIYEATLALLRLDQNKAEVQCFAPDINQMHVMNHLTSEEAEGEIRNVLVESARLARGNIKNITEAKVEDFDALIMPGGFGAAKNLSDYASKGSDLTVQADVLSFAQAMQQTGKVIGLICISPVMAVAICGKGVKCSIGNDVETLAYITAMGGEHVECKVDDICVDEDNKLVSTPAFMLAERISEIAEGINKLVDKVLEMS